MPPRRGQALRAVREPRFLPPAARRALSVQAEQEAQQRGKEWLHDADDDLLACRASGHAFPKIRTRRGRLAEGLSAARQHDGAYQIRMVCRDCGTARTLTTLPGGALDLPARYSYEYPDGYASPKGSGVTRREALAEMWRRSLEAVQAAGDRNG